VRVDAEKHYLWHRLFGNKPVDVVARELNTKWFNPEYVVVYRCTLKRGFLPKVLQ